jgi:adenosine deaminase
MTERAFLERFIARIPKAEIHVHLEGAIQPRTLLRLARRRGVSLPADDEEGLSRFFRFHDFDHFVEVYLLCSSCLRDPEDFQLVVEDFLSEQERQNVLYTEAYLTISTHIANGVNAGEVADALRETISAAESRRGVRLRLIPDIVRNAPIDRADQTLEWALDHRDDLVAALGIAGKETSPCEPFREHFLEAERMGLARVAHAGEQTRAEDVWRVLEACRPQRIGHGIRAADDGELLAELRRRCIPLEVSQSSNVCLGTTESHAEHPLPKLHESGVAFSINTDDPALFDTCLNREYRLAAELLDLSPREIGDLSLAALSHSFLPGAEKDRLETEFSRQIDFALAEIADI